MWLTHVDKCFEEVVWSTHIDKCLEEVVWCTHADKYLVHTFRQMFRGGGVVHPCFTNVKTRWCGAPM